MNDLNVGNGKATATGFIAIGRLKGFEAARFIAAIFVVWIHASIELKLSIHHDAGFIGRFAVPFFVVSSIFFASIASWSKPKQGFALYFSARFTRIYVPFIVWSGIYILLKTMQGRSTPWSVALLWDGGSYQLWYLPYVFALCVCLFPAQRLVQRVPHHAQKIAAVSAVLGLAVALIPDNWLGDMRLFGYEAPHAWIGTLPAAFFGFSLACIYGFGERQKWTSRNLGFLSATLAVLCVFASCTLTEISSLLYNIAGLALGISALGGSLAPQSTLSNWCRKFSPLGKLSFGIYLTHILFIGPMRSIATHYGLNTTLAFAALATSLALVASMVLTLGLLKIRQLSWLVR